MPVFAANCTNLGDLLTMQLFEPLLCFLVGPVLIMRIKVCVVRIRCSNLGGGFRRCSGCCCRSGCSGPLRLPLGWALRVIITVVVIIVIVVIIIIVICVRIIVVVIIIIIQIVKRFSAEFVRDQVFLQRRFGACKIEDGLKLNEAEHGRSFI